MKRQVFFSFHYQPDSRRASQVRNIGALDGNELLGAGRRPGLPLAP